jgi:peptidyl-prolyl cis-trans isomerase C
MMDNKRRAGKSSRTNPLSKKWYLELRSHDNLRILIPLKKERARIVKSLKHVISLFVLVLTVCCFHVLGAMQNAKSKIDAPAAPAAAKPQVNAPENEEIPPADPNALFPAVVARVNGQPILGRELESLVRSELVGIGNPSWKDLREDYRNELTVSALSSLANAKLMYQKAAAAGIQVTDAEVQTGLKNYSSRFGSDAEMNEALAQQLLDRDSLKKNIARDLIISKYLDNTIVKTVTVTADEVAKYYTANPTQFSHPEIVRSSHILIRTGATSDLDVQAKQRADALLARAKKGEDFAKLAKENSADTSASEGGDLGFAKKGDMVQEFSDAIFSMAVGDIRLVKTQYGYHVIKVTEKKKEGISTLEEVKEELTNLLKRNKAQVEMEKLVKQLRDESKIEVMLSKGQTSKQ